MILKVILSVNICKIFSRIKGFTLRPIVSVFRRNSNVVWSQILSLRNQWSHREHFCHLVVVRQFNLIRRQFDTRLYPRQKTAWKLTQLLIFNDNFTKSTSIKKNFGFKNSPKWRGYTRWHESNFAYMYMFFAQIAVVGLDLGFFFICS